MLVDICQRFDAIVTVEEGQKIGGFGSGVLEFISQNITYKPEIKILGIDDKFIEHGSQDELLRDIGLDSEGIFKQIMNFLVKIKSPAIENKFISGK